MKIMWILWWGAFSEARSIVHTESYPSWRMVHQLLNSNTVFPPEGYRVLVVHCRSRDPASLWRSGHFLEARAGDFRHSLLNDGVRVMPGDACRCKDESWLEFAVMERYIRAEQRQCQLLIDEVKCHEARSTAWMEIRGPSDKSSPSHRLRRGAS